MRVIEKAAKQITHHQMSGKICSLLDESLHQPLSICPGKESAELPAQNVNETSSQIMEGDEPLLGVSRPPAPCRFRSQSETSLSKKRMAWAGKHNTNVCSESLATFSHYNVSSYLSGSCRGCSGSRGGSGGTRSF